MPIYLDLANLILDKRIIEKKYTGGIAQFRIDYINERHPMNQEDDELFSISKMNVDEFDINKGIHRNNLNFGTEYCNYLLLFH